MKKALRWLTRIIIGLIVLILLVVSIAIIFKIPIDLTRFKEPVEVLLSKGLNRNVRIEQSVVISTSLSPYFTLKGLLIENPEGFETPNFLSMDLAKIQVELWPLLQKKVHISEFQVQGLHVTLEETKAGKMSWIFNPDKEGKEEAPQGVTQEEEIVPSAKPIELASDTLVVRKLDLQDIEVNLFRPGSNTPSQIQLKNCIGTMLPGKPMQINLDGNALDFDYTIDISIGSLEELLLENTSWMEISTSIAETAFTFNGNVDLSTASKSMSLQATVQGENLASLNNLLHLDLPPLASYRLETGLHLRPNEYELQRLMIRTGSSSLEGGAKVLKSEDKVSIDLKLQSQMVQIDDFIFDDWSWTKDQDVSKEPEETELTDKSEKTETEIVSSEAETPAYNKILDEELLARFDCSLSIEANKVLSGKDDLGSGRLRATVQDGRIRIDPLMFQLPGGKIEMMASIKPGAEKSDAELKVDMQNFDIGFLVRRSKPESDMGGLVNVFTDLHSSAATIAELLENGNGYLDFSGNLENFNAGIIDLWAVNLVAAIVTSTEKNKSQLNCAVGRWSVTDGILKSDAFFIDTGKIRICAEGTVNLKNKQIDIDVKPRAKKPEFFSLATPLKVNGSFSDINVGLGNGAIVGTAIKFIVSPLTTPIKRTFVDKIPTNGSDVCTMELGQENRDKIVVPMCQ